MRDLTDLDAAWRLLEKHADTHPMPAPPLPVRPRAGRRIWLVAAASVAVAATAVAVAMVSSSGGNHQARTPAGGQTTAAAQPSASTSVDWAALPTDHYRFVFDRLGATRITSVIGVGTPHGLPGDDTYQEVQTDGPYGRLVFKVNEPGGWAPPADAATTTVNGETAYYGVFLRHPEIPGHPVPPRWSLAWQYAPGAWVTVGDMSGDPMPIDEARTVAGLVEIGDGGPIPDPLPQDR